MNHIFERALVIHGSVYDFETAVFEDHFKSEGLISSKKSLF